MAEGMSMAKERNTSVFEDLFGIAAMLPWWVGTVLAVASYLALRHYASVDMQTDSAPGQMGQRIVGQMTKAPAFYGQFIVPLLFLVLRPALFETLRPELFRGETRRMSHAVARRIFSGSSVGQGAYRARGSLGGKRQGSSGS